MVSVTGGEKGVRGEKRVVTSEGLEPSTFGFVDRRSDSN